MVHLRQPEVHEINGTKYEFCLFPPPEALKILTRLTKRILPSVGGAFSGTDIKGLADALSGAVNLESLTVKLAENMDEDEVQNTIKNILSHVRIDNREIQFAVDFTGEIATMFEVVGKALEVNYRDFFNGLKERLRVAGEKASTQAK